MSPLELAGVGIGVLVAMILVRVPVAVALGLVGYGGYALLEGPTRAGLVLGAVPLELASAYTLSVIPLFTLMGAVAAVSGLSADLFRAANAMLRGTRGSLAVASIFASGLFGAICGSSVATALTMSRVSIPQMLAANYPPGLAAGAVAAGGTLGILIPPSLILMIYAIFAEQSVAALFAASLVPGLVLTGLYCLTALVLGRRQVPGSARAAAVDAVDAGQEAAPSPDSPGTVEGRVIAGGGAPDAHPVEPGVAFLPALARIWHVVLLFAVSIGGIYSGLFTPTEAAAVGALGAVVLALALGRSTVRELYAALLETTRLVSSVVFIVLGSSVFSYFIVQTGLSDAMGEALRGAGLGPIGVILLLCAAYVVMGCFLEGIAMILITLPIALPLVTSLGFDPVWFGVLLVILIEIGLITPPLGINLFVIKAVSPELSLTDIYVGALPFLVAPLALIGLMIAWPELVLWLPSLVG